MSLVNWVELLAVVLAVIAAWLSVRPAPDLDWERLFKTALVTVIRGEVESVGGDAAAWWGRVRGIVPYQPAAQRPDALLESPDTDEIPVPARDGERALATTMAALESPAERWAEMFESEVTRQELLLDPAMLGPAYDPSTVLAPDLGWDAVAAWSVALQDALTRRLAEVVVLAAAPWHERLVAAAPHVRVVPLPVDGADPAADASAIAATLTANADRCFILTTAGVVQPVLRALHATPQLRDRVLGLLHLGGELDREWLAAHFHHEQLDTELNRRTGYMSLIDVDPDEPLARSWADQRFPVPPVPRTGWTPIEAVDLGPLAIDRVEPELLTRALWVLIVFRLARSAS
jgi:hypothetical protein